MPGARGVCRRHDHSNRKYRGKETMDETIGYINFNSAEDVAANAVKMARDPAKGHTQLVQLVYELMKQPEPDAATLAHILSGK
jgi:hypothetical protein